MTAGIVARDTGSRDTGSRDTGIVGAVPAATDTTVRYAALETPIGRLHLFGTARGLLTLALPNEE